MGDGLRKYRVWSVYGPESKGSEVGAYSPEDAARDFCSYAIPESGTFDYYVRSLMNADEAKTVHRVRVTVTQTFDAQLLLPTDEVPHA